MTLSLIGVGVSARPQRAIASGASVAAMPVTSQNFLGLGTTLGGCIWPKPTGGEPAGCVTNGVPPDPVGAVGPDDYVEAVNSGFAVFNKTTGDLIQAPTFLNTLWTGFPTTDGNACATENDGDPMVRYDQLADRWLISQFDVHNFISSSTGPSYQCVAVSKTGDPTGEYWLYDFKYNAGINDYTKIAVWPDAYYATSNLFSGQGQYTGAQMCAWDRTAMLAGQPATQQCFTTSTSYFGLLPADIDGVTPPPDGAPEYAVALGTNALRVWRFHVDWVTPANSTFTGPTSLAVTSYSQACSGGNCVAQPSPGNALASLGDRLMDRLSYRNYGDHESLVLNHSITAGSAVGVRWYELRSASGTVSVYQQGTFAPNDGNYRWMGSIAQDHNGDIAVGYSLSGSTTKPSIAYAGRLAGDPLGTMGQGEATIVTGGGVESGTFSDGSPANRWGDYSSMTVDPSDDCTFWYVSEYYPTNGFANWDTRIVSFRFPGCPSHTLTVTTAGAGTGSVASSPAGIDCGSTCSASFDQGAQVTLTASPADGSTLAGWSGGGCSGTGTCQVTMDSDQAVTATFATIPATPAGLTATAGNAHVALAWTAPSDDGGSPVTGYHVYRSTTSGEQGTSVGTVSGTTFSDTGPTNDVRYYYEVSAVNAAGEGPVSAQVSALPDGTPPTVTVTSPAQPFQLSPSVTFRYSAADTAGGVASFDVRYRVASWNGGFGTYVRPSAWQRTTRTTATVTSSPGHEYCFDVRARDHIGNLSAWTKDRCTALPLDDRALAAATGSWTRGTYSSDYRGTYTQTKTSGATLRRTGAQLDRMALLVTRCATCGKVAIYLNGRYWRTVSTYHASTQYEQLLVLPAFTLGSDTIVLKAVSPGKKLLVDGIGVTRN